MTTRVQIRSPFGNHLAVRVDVSNPATGLVQNSVTLGHGQSTELYVHSGSALHVTEVPLESAPAPRGRSEMTVGEKAAGCDFNPSGDSSVAECKTAVAKLIDQMHALRSVPGVLPEQARYASIAITELEGAQMRAVKALTWRP